MAETLDANGNPIMQLEPMIVTGPANLDPIVVTAKKIPVPFDWRDWVKPPKVFIVAGVLATLAYFLLNRPRKSRRRKVRR